jgi:PAS domain S-box-containing protein
MRINLPVTQQNFDYSGDELLVSSTNTKGEITHCNPAFVRVSGYGYDELIGQPHNIIRHPDMPAEAYKDLWRTIGRGEPWTGLVKNRRKNGDHYWVRANATPVVRGGKLTGYMSVRTQPAREEVAAAEKLYADFRTGRAGRRRFRHGLIVRTGPMAWASLPQTLPLHWRIHLAGFALAALPWPAPGAWACTTAASPCSPPGRWRPTRCPRCGWPTRSRGPCAACCTRRRAWPRARCSRVCTWTASTTSAC